MGSEFASEFVNRKAHGVVIAVKYAYVKLELIGSNIIAVATSISSLSTVSSQIEMFSWRQGSLALIGSH
jgi:hypothetical protein